MVKVFVLFAYLCLCVCMALFSSCNKKTMSHSSNEGKSSILSKEERLGLFCESPLNVNTNVFKQKINNIEFYKSYILIENLHVNKEYELNKDNYVTIGAVNFNANKDSIIRIASNSDVIEILKNKFTERTIYMRINSKDINLNCGIYLGMSLDQFVELMPLKVDEYYVASFESEESLELKFIFDKEKKHLKEILYRLIIE